MPSLESEFREVSFALRRTRYTNASRAGRRSSRSQRHLFFQSSTPRCHIWQIEQHDAAQPHLLKPSPGLFAPIRFRSRSLSHRCQRTSGHRNSSPKGKEKMKLEKAEDARSLPTCHCTLSSNIGIGESRHVNIPQELPRIGPNCKCAEWLPQDTPTGASGPAK